MGFFDWVKEGFSVPESHKFEVIDISFTKDDLTRLSSENQNTKLKHRDRLVREKEAKDAESKRIFESRIRDIINPIKAECLASAKLGYVRAYISEVMFGEHIPAYMTFTNMYSNAIPSDEVISNYSLMLLAIDRLQLEGYKILLVASSDVPRDCLNADYDHLPSIPFEYTTYKNGEYFIVIDWS